jgi:phage baseplate assembly protein W
VAVATTLQIRPNPLKPTPVKQVSEDIQQTLGSGLSFHQPQENNFFFATGLEKIRQSMIAILLTPIGSHLGRPDFGSMLPFLVFERENLALQKEIEIYTKQALNKWEPRITVISTQSEFMENAVNVVVLYKINGTNATQYLSVPIYFNANVGSYENPRQFTVGGRPLF